MSHGRAGEMRQPPPAEPDSPAPIQDGCGIRGRARGRLLKISNTKSTRNVAVGTVKKSIEAISAAWFSKNVRQLSDGGFRWPTMYFETEARLISMPSFSSSPWIRGAPREHWLLTSAG
jgi:hypothetical protein